MLSLSGALAKHKRLVIIVLVAAVAALAAAIVIPMIKEDPALRACKEDCRKLIGALVSKEHRENFELQCFAKCKSALR